VKIAVPALAVTLAFAFTPLPALHAQQAERFDLTGSHLKVYNLIGTLQVVPATGAGASAAVTRQGSDGAKLTVQNDGGALRVLYPGNEYVYPAMGDNSQTTIRVRDDGSFHGDWDGGGRKVKISSRGSGSTAWADIKLSIPAGARVELNVGVGKVTLANVNGDIEVETASGDVDVKSTTGSLSIDTGSGDVTLAGHDGPLSIDTGSGDVLLGSVKTGELSIDTGSGDVEIDGLSASQLEIDTGSGEITLTGAAVSVLSIDTGSGDIRLSLTSDIDQLSVDTGSGDVVLTAPRSLGATVRIETSSGDIDTEFPLQVTRKGRDGLSGTIGNGKGTISIDTASGDVTLKQQP